MAVIEAPNTILSIDELRMVVSGQVILPGDADYDKARAIQNGAIDRRPAAIVRAANAADVQHVVRLARDKGIELAVRSGGHSLAGHSVIDNGIVLNLSAMKGLEIDVEGRTAWAESGLTAGEYNRAVAVYGLATGFGDTGSVGLGGITTGGGIGFLVRKYGLTIDNLLAAEIVTAGGQLLHVDAETHPDLFWAIRGGGGNFGVVTRFKFRLHDVPVVVGGILMLPASAEVLAKFIAEAEKAPEELSAIVNVMPIPPLPFLPAEQHGKLAIIALMCYAVNGGDIEAGQKAIAPFRALATPIVDMVHPASYPDIYPPDEEAGTGLLARTLFLNSFDLVAAKKVMEHMSGPHTGMSIAQFRVLGGAMARVPAEATAFAHRSKRMMATVLTFFRHPEHRAAREAWIDAIAGDLQRGDLTSGAYVNFLGDEGKGRVREAYPGATWDRLREIKAKYDPTNLFHLNQNIPPR